jgi:hypothetical protein
MAGENDIRDKLAKLEALFARGATVGERAAAGAARDRLQARLGLELDGGEEPETEMQGGLNRSSQQPDAGGCDVEEEASCGSGWAAPAAVSGPPACLAARSSDPVLVSGRLGSFQRRRGRRGGCIAGGWDPLVRGGRWHATIASCTVREGAVGAVPVLRRA